MLKVFADSISAGLLISIGGCVYLSCESRYVGAVLFAVGLLCICMKGYYLFTGKIGYAVSDHSLKNCKALLTGLAGNLLATLVVGLLVRFAIPVQETAVKLCAAKLTQTLPQAFIRAVFCGVLMYLAVSIYREKSSALAILLCVPTFILSGFEHSIADMFYFSVAGISSGAAMLFIAAVVAGNTVGGMLLPLIGLLHEKEVQHG